MTRSLLVWAIVLLLLSACGCKDNTIDPVNPEDSLNVAVSVSPSSFSVGESVTVTVEVQNQTKSRISFGVGSGSSQCHAVVLIGGDNCLIQDNRIFTCDAPIISYDPGECRTESWDWTGIIVIDGVEEQLTPGSYELSGLTGSFWSPPVTVVISD